MFFAALAGSNYISALGSKKQEAVVIRSRVMSETTSVELRIKTYDRIEELA
jgi:hypothetical protein